MPRWKPLAKVLNALTASDTEDIHAQERKYTVTTAEFSCLLNLRAAYKGLRPESIPVVHAGECRSICLSAGSLFRLADVQLPSQLLEPPASLSVARGLDPKAGLQR